MLGLLPASALAESADTAAASDGTAVADDNDSTSSITSYYVPVDVTASDEIFSSTATNRTLLTNYYILVSSTDSESGETTYSLYQAYYTYSSTDEDVTVTLYTSGDATESYGTLTYSTGGGGNSQTTSSVTLYYCTSGTFENNYYSFTVDYESTEALWDVSNTSGYTIIRGYYYYDESTGILYDEVYYRVTLDDSGKIACVTLYYETNGTYVEIGTIYPEDSTDSNGNTLTSNIITLYAEFEMDLDYYKSSAVVYWDLDNYDNDQQEENSYITSVTFGSTTTTDDEGNETTTANSVPFGESTKTDFSDSSDTDWTNGSGGLVLSSVYADVEDAPSVESYATLTIVPADGYYVSKVIIACAPYAGGSTSDDDGDNNGPGGNNGPGTFSLAAASDESEAAAASEDNVAAAAESTGRQTPYSCSTYVTGQAYSESFTLNENTTASNGFELTINMSNINFAHSGANVTNETMIYFILIEVAAIPTPAYVEYDYGDIVSYISAYNTANELTSTSDGYVSSSIFTSDADGWTDTYTVSATDDDGNTITSDGNVYTDDSSGSYSGTITGNGGVLTDDTQYEYVYDTSGTIKTSSWKHYANSITNGAVEAAAAAGYVFAGWAVTWYANASVATGTDGSYTKTTSNYNYYTITFSDTLYTSLRTEGAEVQIVGHVRLVAQWVKADDITQVIDYGLPVSTDVAEENEDDLALKAITGEVSSRISSETSYSSATTVELSTKITNVQYSVTTTTTTTDEDGGETTSTTTNYQITAAGTYGDFTVDSDDNGTAIYTLDTQMTGIESVEYQVTLSYVTGSGSSATATELCKPTGTISIIPATSMYYEEDFGVTFEDYSVTTSAENENGSTTSTTTTYQTVKSQGLITYSMGAVYWIQKGASLNYTQETGIVGTTDDSTYGADTSYLTNLADSNGTSMYADVTGDYDATFSYSFTGTGTAIYARTSNDSAYIGVVVKDSSNVVVDTKYIDTRVVEDSSTYSSSSGGTTLYNIPVYELTDQDWGTYTVTVTVYDDDTPVNGWYTTSTTTDEDGNESTTNTLVEGSDESGSEFYLDGIRIYDPLGTGGTTTSTDDTMDNDSTTSATNCGDDYVIALAAYKEDVEAYHTEINISDKLEKDIESNCLSDSTDSEDDSSSNNFVTITDVDGDITSYSSYFDIGPDNELYLYGSSSSSNDANAADDSETEESTTYTVTFYLLNWDADEYNVYLGLKAPLGTSSSVQIGNTTIVTISGSADCYYQLDDYISTTTEAVTLTSDDSSTETTATKVTITGVSGLTALTWLKITGTSETTSVAYASDITVENEDDNGGIAETLVIEEDTVYLVSATAYASLTASADEEDTESDMLDDDAMGVDPDDSEDEEDSAEPETEEDEEDESSVFEPETFSASISYLKLLRYASITVKASSDVSYITVNGEIVTGRTFINKNTKIFNCTASRVSSGTTFEIIAYDSDGTASEPITLTAK